MPLTPEEEKKLREKVQEELKNREEILEQERQKKEEEQRQKLEKNLRQKIREEEEEKYYTEKGYVKYTNHSGVAEWILPEEAERRRQKRRYKKTGSKHKKNQKKRFIQIVTNSSIIVIVVALLVVIYKFIPSKEADYGTVIINSDVPAAKIFMDGNDLNRFTPDTLANISTGIHYLSVYKDGFTSWPPMETISTTSKKTSHLNFSLKSSAYFGKITIESNLSDFDLYIDGIPHKMQGSYLEIPAGYHVFTVVKKGYLPKPSYHRVLIEDDQIKTLTFNFEPDEEIGYLQISSNRKNEYVYLDDKFTGLKANGKSFPVKAGIYEISIKENGYLSKPEMKMLNLLPNENKVVIFHSHPVEEKQNINLFTEEPGAVIIVNGNWTPFVTPMKNLALSPGSHYINFMHGDKTYSEKDILVNPAKLNTNTLKYNF
jgi:hypothetical protein